jgi:periplasmic divalent cation tolerance protein
LAGLGRFSALALGLSAYRFRLPLPASRFSAFQQMLLAWTTVATPDDASRLAQGAVEAHLAACVQVDGPVTSHYRWDGKIESAQEYRLMFKLLPEQAGELEAWIRDRHPYQTPEWIVVRAEHVSEKYLSWARGTSTPAPLHKSQSPT